MNAPCEMSQHPALLLLASPPLLPAFASLPEITIAADQGATSDRLTNRIISSLTIDGLKSISAQRLICSPASIT